MNKRPKIITTHAQPSRNQLSTLFKYGFTGASAALLDFALFALSLHFLTLNLSQEYYLDFFSPLVIANTLGILGGFLWSFLLQKYWAFKTRGNALLQLTATAALLLFNITITSLAIPLIAANMAISVEAAKIIMQVTVVGWNYLIYNYIVFKHCEGKE